MKKIHGVLACLLATATLAFYGCTNPSGGGGGGGGVEAPVTYTVTFDGNGSTGTVPAALTQASKGAAITLPGKGDLAKDGYAFVGWSNTADGAAVASPYTPTANITLYARWISLFDAAKAELKADIDAITAFAESGTPYTVGAAFRGAAAAVPVGLKAIDAAAIADAQAAHDDPGATVASLNQAKEALAAAKGSAVPGALGLAVRVKDAPTGTTIYLYGDESDFAGVRPGFVPANITGKAITLEGAGEERTITLASAGSGALFYLGTGGALTLNANVTLTGKSDNNSALVYANGTAFTMKAGSKITGNRNGDSPGGGGVAVASGTFTMEGGVISDNQANGLGRSGGGVYVAGGGTFTMKGGVISGNKTFSSTRGGGGVCVEGLFTMEGGEISGNSSPAGYGGGVLVYYSSGKFFMPGGEISGNTASSDTYGHALFNSGGQAYFGAYTDTPNPADEILSPNDGTIEGRAAKD